MNEQNVPPNPPASQDGGPAVTWGTPRPDGPRSYRAAVPQELLSAASILRVLAIIGLIAVALSVFGLMMLASIAGEHEGIGAVVGLILLAAVASAILSVALLVQSPRVRDGDVRACRTAVVLLGISIAFRVLSLFPIEVNLGWLINVGLLVTTIVAVAKLRSDAAKAYYARA